MDAAFRWVDKGFVWVGMFRVMFYCAWVVVLSMCMNRDWYAASDWLAGLWYVKCELEFD